MTTVPALRIHLLGAFRVLVNACPVPETAWRSKRAAALVTLLALVPHYRLHREQVMETFWPELDPDAQANNLNVAASRARRALALVGAPPGVFLVRRGETIVLGPPEAVWIDVAAFEEAVAVAWQDGSPGAFRAALTLFTGDLLVADPYAEWAEVRRTALRASLLAVLTRLGHLHAAGGETGYAIEAYRHLVALEPAHEEAGVALMRLHAGQGRRVLALAEFDRLVDALRRDLDAAPGRATIELADAIRAGRHPESADRAEPDATPVAAVRSGASGRLPVPLGDLVGRGRERAEVRQMLATGRLVTLTGPGGIGKTRLALAVAHEVRAAFPDGVVFVDLSPVRDAGLVAAVIAQTLDVREPDGPSPLEGVASSLRDKRMLLVLDNFEQVVDEAPVVTILLERAPRLKILVTSRTSLRVGAEREYPVPPLPVPDVGQAPWDSALDDVPAVVLFVQRAQGVKPGFRMTSENAAAIADVCRRLEGLPLAIELAAARVKVLTPETMLTRLDRPLALLVGDRRDLPARQQTIRRTIAWSHDLLSPPEQRLFRRLAVFVGGWTLDDAEAVVDPDGALGIDVLDGLASLVDKSLVLQREHADGMRFGLLETIHEYALEHLTASGDADRVRAAHVAQVVALAERARPHLESADQAVWLDRLEREEGNLRAALDRIRERGEPELGLRLVVALQMYWFIRGRVVEGCALTLAVVALPGTAAFSALRADALNGVGFLARDGDDELAHWAGAESRSIARDARDRKREADALANLGYVALQRGELAEAQVLFGDCLAMNRAVDNPQGIADALSFLALSAHHRQDFVEARRLNEESLAIWEGLDDRQGIVWARTRLAAVLLRQGEDARAFVELASGLAIARELDFRWGLSWAFDGLAQLTAGRDACHLAAGLAAAAAAVRAASGLTTSAIDHAEIGRLGRRLETAIGADAMAAAGSKDDRRTPDEWIRAVRDVLGGGL